MLFGGLNNSENEVFSNQLKNINFIIFVCIMHRWEKLVTWNFKPVQSFSFFNSNARTALLDKDKVHLYYVGLQFPKNWKLTIHILMVDHRNTSLKESGPTDYPAPEPCFICNVLVYFYNKLYLDRYMIYRSF